MDKIWTVIYYETEDGECPVKDFILTRSLNNRAKILNIISLLEKKGPNLPRPFADYLENGIHELRIKLSGEQIRILYFFCYRDFIILTHPLHKTMDKVPKLEIDRAKNYRSDYLNRVNENLLRKDLINADI